MADFKTTQEKFIAMTVVIAVGTIFLGWNFVVKPQLRKASEMSVEQGDYRARKDLVAKIADVEKRLALFRQRLPEKTEVSWLIETLNQLADDAGISLLSVTPVNREPFESYYRLPVRIEIECSYSELGDFVSRVENHPRFIKVNTLRAEGSRTPEQTASVKLRATLMLSAFYPIGELVS